MLMQFLDRDTTIFIEGPVGSLETIISRPVTDATSAIGLVCHPHPLQGGTMSNKVVTTLARVLSDLGLWSVRFNFRGVGQSTGQYAKGDGESEDALAVINWIKQQFPGRAIWLAGFSFGAYVALRVANQIDVAQLITVAPPVHHFPITALPDINCPWLLVQGEEDEVVSPTAVFAWTQQLKKPPQIIRMATGHFFHGKLIQLREELVTALKPIEGSQ